MYSLKQLKLMQEGLKHKLINEMITDAEILLLLLMFNKTDKITVNDISDTLLFVYGYDKRRILGILDRLKPVISDSLLEKLLDSIAPP